MSNKIRIGIIFCANKEHKWEFRNGGIHPERPDRVLRAERILGEKYKSLVYEAFNYTIREVIDFLTQGKHDAEHMREIKNGFVDKNSAYSLGDESFEACMREVMCLMTMCELMKGDKIDVALNVIRPPGHHCCNKKQAGFCLVNTAIIAAKALLKSYNRLSIMDIDLHHGGGTQKMMERERGIMYTSIHNKNVWSDGLYVRGINGKRGRVVNIALPGLSNDGDYIYASELLIKEMKEFSSEMLILSAGFDAHKEEQGVGDNIQQRMSVTSNYYGQLGNMLVNNFNKIFLILEGGYNEKAIAESLERMIEGFQGKSNFRLSGRLRKNVKDIVDKI